MSTSLDKDSNKCAKDHDYVWIYCEKCGYDHAVMLKCSDLTCEICRRRDYYRLKDGYKDFFRNRQRLKFLSLTLKNEKYLSHEKVKKLRDSFKKLLRRKEIKKRLRGGFYMIEVTNKGNGWHIHLHAIVDADYIPQDLISRLWKDITKDSYIVDIRTVNKGLEALCYILKYLNKPPVIGNLEYHYNQYMAGLRKFAFFGSWYPVKLESDHVFICPNCGNDTWITEFQIEEQCRLMREGKEGIVFQ